MNSGEHGTPFRSPFPQGKGVGGLGAVRPAGIETLYVRQFEHFARCVRTREEPSANLAQGAALMRALEAAYLSAKNGREVRIEEVP